VNDSADRRPSRLLHRPPASQYDPHFSIFQATHSNTGEDFQLDQTKVKSVDHSNCPIPDDLFCNQIRRFLRTVANPVWTPTPCGLRPTGWNVRVAANGQAIDFFWIVPLHHSVSESRLTPTGKQIALYGTLRALSALTAAKLCHGDLRLEDVLLDKRCYPTIARAGLLVPQKAQELNEKGPDLIGHVSPIAFKCTEWKDQAILKVDEYALGMIIWQLLEENLIEIERVGSEMFKKAILRGAWPRTSDKSRPFREALERAWAERSRSAIAKKLMTDFEKGEGWIAGVDADAFWQYKASLDSEQEKAERVRMIQPTFLKLFEGEKCLSPMTGGSTLIEKLARLLAWLNGGEDCSDPQSYGPIVESLGSQGTLDRQLLIGIQRPPVFVSLFTTGMIDILRLTVVQSIGEKTWEVTCDKKTVDALKRVPIANSPQQIVHYSKEVFAIGSGHPALLHLVGWNVHLRTAWSWHQMNVIWFHSKSSLFMSDSDRCIGEW
jgi:hypothetical protein